MVYLKVGNLSLTSSYVAVATFMAMFGARCTGLLGLTSMVLVMTAASSPLRRKTSACSKGK